jgi:hypothetical protein
MSPLTSRTPPKVPAKISAAVHPPATKAPLGGELASGVAAASLPDAESAAASRPNAVSVAASLLDGESEVDLLESTRASLSRGRGASTNLPSATLESGRFTPESP